MTLESTTSKAVYTGNGATTEFPFSFKVWEEAQILVSVTDAQGYVQETGEYSVTLSAGGGTVSYLHAGAPLPSGWKLAITRDMSFTQGVDLLSGTRFDPQVLEDALDMACAERQQLLEALERAVIVPPTEDRTPEQMAEDIMVAYRFMQQAVAAVNQAMTNLFAQTIEPFTTKDGVVEYEVGEDIVLDPDANNLLLSLGGVVQEPDKAYTIIGKNRIRFSSNPGAGLRVWGISSLSFANPDIRAVVEKAIAKIQDEANKIIATDSFTVPGATESRNLLERFGDWANVKDFGAKGNGAADDTAAFNAIPDNIAGYVPAGNYRVSNPYDLGAKKRFFGHGTIIFDNAEHRRKGGSSGSASNPEKYTLFFDYASRDDVSVTINGAPQTITWIDDYTIEAPGSESGDDVRIVVKNGRYTLSAVPESVRAFSCYASGGKDSVLSDEPAEITSGGNNTAFGSRAMEHITTGGNNTAFGSKALQNASIGENNTATGFQALYRSNGNNNTAYGSIAGEWITSGSGNTTVGANAGKKIVTGNNNTALGYEALGENQTGNLNTAVGHRALGNTGDAEISENTAVGAFAGDLAKGIRNTWIGYRSGASENGSDGSDNVAVGMFAMRNQNGADRNTVVGTGAATNIANYTDNVVAGFEAGTDLTGNGSVIIGSGAGKKASSGSVIIGKDSAPKAEGTNNVVIGSASGTNLTSGINNTIIGCNAGNLGASSQAFDAFDGCSIIGYNSRATGDNQVQLGASGTTVYAYGAVQDRSDARDKADIRDTQLGLSFILALRPVDFRWDMREDYVVPSSDGKSVEVIAKDGSKKRNRFHHGFIAQEVKEILDNKGIDFGGYQDHKVNGGNDVLSLGYAEFIAPLVRAVQELSAKNNDLEQRIIALEEAIKKG